MALLRRHLERSRALSPPGSSHALELDALRAPEVSFWAALEGAALVGVGALLRLSAEHGEVKSMHTAEPARGRGVASALLRHIMATARDQGLRRLSLETGTQPGFAPARALYRRHGFRPCPPFAGYRPDPASVFMTVELGPG